MALQEVNQQSDILTDDQVSSGVIFAQVRSRRLNQKIGKVFADKDSKAKAGMPKSVVDRVQEQIIGDVTATNKLHRFGWYLGGRRRSQKEGLSATVLWRAKVSCELKRMLRRLVLVVRAYHDQLAGSRNSESFHPPSTLLVMEMQQKRPQW